MKKDFFALVLGRGIQLALTIFLLKVLTAKLSPTEVGQYYYIVAFTSCFTLLILNPIGMWAARHISEWQTRGFRWSSIFYRLVYLHLGVAFLGGGIAYLFNNLFQQAAGLSSLTLAICVAGGVAFLAFYQTLAGLINIIADKATYGLMVAIGQIVILLAISPVLVGLKINLIGWFGLLFLGNGIAILLFQRRLSTQLQNEFASVANTSDLLRWTQFKAFCLPIVAVTACVWVQTQAYRIVSAQLADLNKFAIMVVGLSIAANIGGTIETIIHQYLLPDYFRALADPTVDADRAWVRMFNGATLMMGIASFGMFFLCVPIIRILTNSEYLDAANFVRWGAAIEFFRVLANVLYLRSVGLKNITIAVPRFLAGATIALAAFLIAPLNANNSIAIVLSGLLTSTIVSFAGLAKLNASRSSWKLQPRRFLAVGALACPLSAGVMIRGDSNTTLLISSVVVAAAYCVAVLHVSFKRGLF